MYTRFVKRFQLKTTKENSMEKKWWQKEVVYQIYPRSFKDSNSDGNGDINGITEKLKYLSNLGVTMIWICPIFKSPMVDNGYDISSFEEINPMFGTLSDLDKLIATAKQLNIKVMLDLVINHTSDEHEWFKKALKYPNSKYRDYYIFKSSQNGNRPNNWRSLFGGSVWEPVPGENTFYFHSFHKKQPDLNWETPELRNEIYNIVNWWLNRGISGFRLDSITFLKKNQSFKSFPSDGNDGLVSCTKGTRNQPGLDIFLKELNKKTFSKHNCITVGEAPGVKYSQLDDFIGDNGYFSMIFDFHYADIDVESGSEWWKRTDWTVKDFKRLLFRSQDALQLAGWGANFIENHDQPRALSKYIQDPKYQNAIGAKALAAMYFFLRGTPFIYQGQELGMHNFTRSSIKEFDDVSSVDNYRRAVKEGFDHVQALQFVNLRSRDNTRTPFPWNILKNAGFSEANPWLSLTEGYQDLNCEEESAQKDSVLNFYKKMIQLRNSSENSEELVYGDIHELTEIPNEVIGYVRGSKQHFYSYTNLSSSSISIKISFKAKVLLNNYPSLNLENQKLKLKPYQTVLLKEER